MENFMKQDFVIEKIDLAVLVRAGHGDLVHRNRINHGLAIFIGGNRTFNFDNKTLKADKNTVIFFPKHSNYNIKEHEKSDCYCINFQLPEGVAFEPFSFKVKNADAFIESFKSAQKIWSKKRSGYNAKVKAELYNIIYNMQSEYTLPYSNSKVIMPAVDYIHSNYYKNNISIKYLASLCNITTVHLRNTFIKTFALSPLKYINNLKMTRAKELLQSNMYSVSDVCFMSGFNDESYFSREFKKHLGISPSKYAKASQK